MAGYTTETAAATTISETLSPKLPRTRVMYSDGSTPILGSNGYVCDCAARIIETLTFLALEAKDPTVISTVGQEAIRLSQQMVDAFTKLRDITTQSAQEEPIAFAQVSRSLNAGIFGIRNLFPRSAWEAFRKSTMLAYRKVDTDRSLQEDVVWSVLVNHEARGQLTTMKGRLQLAVRRGIVGTDEEQVTTWKTAANRFTELMFELSGIDDVKKMDSQSVVSGLSHAMLQYEGNHGRVAVLLNSSSTSSMRISERLKRMIVSNVMSNALKMSQDVGTIQPTITLSCQTVDQNGISYVKLCIDDNLGGFDPKLDIATNEINPVSGQLGNGFSRERHGYPLDQPSQGHGMVFLTQLLQHFGATLTPRNITTSPITEGGLPGKGAQLELLFPVSS